MAKKKLGNTATVAAILPVEIAAIIETRAAGMNISKSKFAAEALKDWLKSGRKITLSEK